MVSIACRRDFTFNCRAIRSAPGGRDPNERAHGFAAIVHGLAAAYAAAGKDRRVREIRTPALIIFYLYTVIVRRRDFFYE